MKKFLVAYGYIGLALISLAGMVVSARLGSNGLVGFFLICLIASVIWSLIWGNGTLS